MHSPTATFALLSLLCLLALSPSSWLLRTSAAASSSPSSGSGLVVDLNDSNFADEVGTREAVVVFYAPWCRQCTIFKPIIEQWAVALRNEGDASTSGLGHLLVAKLDCTLNPSVADERRIQAFPTVQFIRDGKTIADFNGERTLEALTAWAKQHSRPRPGDSASGAPGGLKSNQAERRRPTGAATGTTPAGAPLKPFSFRVELPDFSQLDLTDPRQLKQLWLDLLAIPAMVFVEHPYMCMTCMWTIGLFQGQRGGDRKRRRGEVEKETRRDAPSRKQIGRQLIVCLPDSFLFVPPSRPCAAAGIFFGVVWTSRR